MAERWDKIRDWYMKAYPEDKCGPKIYEYVTFFDIWECLDNRQDIASFLGVRDVQLRKRVLDELITAVGIDAKYIEDKLREKEAGDAAYIERLKNSEKDLKTGKDKRDFILKAIEDFDTVMGVEDITPEFRTRLSVCERVLDHLDV